MGNVSPYRPITEDIEVDSMLTVEEAARRAYGIGAGYRLKTAVASAFDTAWDAEIRFISHWKEILKQGARQGIATTLSQQDNGPLTLPQAHFAFMAGATNQDLDKTLANIGGQSAGA